MEKEIEDIFEITTWDERLVTFRRILSEREKDSTELCLKFIKRILESNGIDVEQEGSKFSQREIESFYWDEKLKEIQYKEEGEIYLGGANLSNRFTKVDLNFVHRSGKYYGKTLGQILDLDRHYFIWIFRNFSYYTDFEILLQKNVFNNEDYKYIKVLMSNYSIITLLRNHLLLNKPRI